MARPRENWPIMYELPNVASATIAPHWQAAYTTFPVRTQAKFERRDRPGVVGSVLASIDSGAAGRCTTSIGGRPGVTTGKSSGSISLVLTPDPDGNGRSRTHRCASDPSN